MYEDDDDEEEGMLIKSPKKKYVLYALYKNVNNEPNPHINSVNNVKKKNLEKN